MKSFYIGIDSGHQGAICIDNGDTSPTIYPMPMIGKELNLRRLWDILIMFKGGNGIVVLEKVGVIFGTSKSTAFSMGYQLGAIEMLLVELAIPYRLCPPKEWQKTMFMGVTEQSKTSKSGKTQVRDTKKMALIACQRLHPGLKLTVGDRASKPHDGIVDAILICDYAKTLKI